MCFVSTSEAARILGVSGATIRNWSRAGHLRITASHPTTFLEKDVLALRGRIRTNRFNRLRQRANKSASGLHHHPDISDPEILADFTALFQNIRLARIDPAQAFFGIAVHYLAVRNEAVLPEDLGKLKFNRIIWRRKAVGRVMANWHSRVAGDVFRPAAESIRAFLSWKEMDDPLGLFYQSLSSVGEKAKSGAYFTPGNVIEESLAALAVTPGTFLDPCCGTGRYLVRAAKRFDLAPEDIHGVDSDPMAVDIAKLNLLLYYTGLDAEPDIRCLDALKDFATGLDACDTNDLIGAIDAIATNPPWGSLKHHPHHKKSTTAIRSRESFSMFIEKSLMLLRPGGALSFLLPEAILKIRTHADIRRLLLEETRITGITLLGRVFPSVFTPIIRLDCVKGTPPREWRIHIDGFKDAHTAPQGRFMENANNAFDVAVTPADHELLDKLYSIPHQTLAGQAEWAMGIVTGDNGRCVLHAPCRESEPIYRGRDISRFALRSPQCHIVFRPETFQQVAPEHFYRAPEKLVYRFVSERLIFAYDDKGLLTLNSANILIPRLPGMPIKVVMAFMNSRVFQYIFTKRFQTRKILKGDLCTLPFPLLSAKEIRRVMMQTEACATGDAGACGLLDAMIFQHFGLSKNEVAVLEEGVREGADRAVF